MTEDRGQRTEKKLLFSVFCLLNMALLLFSGCGPKYTYPADRVPQAIEEISQKEYKLTIDARVTGKTVGALVTVDSIMDESGQIPKEVHEQMGKVMQAVTRVALSTDLPIDFCTVIIRDKAHANELVVTRSLDDSKRANADAIGVEESINRTLFGQEKYAADSTGKKQFILEEVKLEKFLADQIVQRMRFSLAKDQKDTAAPPLILFDGIFDKAEGRRAFRFSILSLRAEDPRQMILGVFKTVNEVLAGYHYLDFDNIEIQDYMNRQKLVIDKKTLIDYQQKLIKDKELLDRHLAESQSIQEAFKLFGFNSPDPTGDKDKPALAATL